jgi:hypothetical protein
MKPDVKQAWLTALRSGDYQQGEGYLRQGDQYYCLGVLCDLYGKAVGPEWEEDHRYYAEPVHSMCRHDTTLPSEVQEWAGIPGKPNPLDLAGMNDNGATFEELANIIERNL